MVCVQVSEIWLWLARFGGWFSPSSLFVPYSWFRRMVLYPNGNSKGNAEGYISPLLAIEETTMLPQHWEVNAEIKLFVFDQNENKYLTAQGIGLIYQRLLLSEFYHISINWLNLNLFNWSVSRSQQWRNKTFPWNEDWMGICKSYFPLKLSMT